jgi:Uma2 family endonuclease
MEHVVEPAPSRLAPSNGPLAQPSRSVSTAPPTDMDQRVILYGMTWKDYEILLAVRGDRAGVRMAYLNGAIELMSPSINHEGVKKTIARLVEAYGEGLGVELNGYGSWTLKNAFMERGLEPDECYVIGQAHKEAPELAIEVIWTSGGLNKLEIYKALGVGEVWIWERGKGISVHLLRGDHHEQAPGSVFFPGLDLSLIERFAVEPNQTRAVIEFRKAVRAQGKKAKRPKSEPSARGRKR